MDIDVKSNERTTTIALRGKLTETFTFEGIVPELSASETIVIDLGEVSRINSIGMRRWLAFVAALPASSQLVLERCPVFLVHQFNMIENAVGRARIKTLYLPFICDKCEEPRDELVAADAVPSGEPATSPCASCGGPMIFDAVESDYFRLVRGAT